MAQVNSIFSGQSGREDGGLPRVTVAHYTADEVIRQFLALYNCLDFKSELAELGIGRFQFLRRRKALRDFRALCIALWGLALTKSFPNDAEEFFTVFMASAPALVGGGEGARLLDRVGVFGKLLLPKKDADFLPVAEYMAEVLAPSAGDRPRLRLKLSLIIRNLYMLIFNRLV